MSAYADRMKKFKAIAANLEMSCDWPECHCRAKRDYWAEEARRLADDTEPLPTQNEIDVLTVEATLVLSCMSARCADRRERYTASLELLRPSFDEAHFHKALERLDAAYAEPAAPEPPTPPASHLSEPDPDYGPMFLGTGGRETLAQRKIRHDEINRQRRMTLHEVPAAPEPKKKGQA